ncbi:MAG: dTDP-4-dehydrorhamnose reductase [Treponemataceae bacterium]|nr:dTDP-4-dehydrorhamnose reductase [Treponemataceae bacterium]
MIWLIGSRGMLGTEVAERLEAQRRHWVGTGSGDVDITNPAALEHFITETESKQYRSSHEAYKDPEERKIKWIINCAAYTAVDKAEDEPDQAASVNADGARNIARTARGHGAKLIHISTDYVFDGTADEPYTEAAAKNPSGVYGRTKSDGEDAVASAMTQYYILRTSWLYGRHGRNFVSTMLRLFNEKDSVSVVSDQSGTPTFAGDLADAIIRIIGRSEKATSIFGRNSAPPFGIYHFSNEGRTTWLEFARTIYELGRKKGLVSKECEITGCSTAEYGAKAPRPAYSVLDKSKISRELKIKIPSWRHSLDGFLNSLAQG